MSVLMELIKLERRDRDLKKQNLQAKQKKTKKSIPSEWKKSG